MMLNTTNALRRQLEAITKKQKRKGSARTIDIQRLVLYLEGTLTLAQDERAFWDELLAQESSEADWSVETELERLIAEIPSLPNAAPVDAPPVCGLKELPSSPSVN